MYIPYDLDNIPDIATLKAKNYDNVDYIQWSPEMKGKDAVSGVKKIGVLTSGGDSPGMNAAVRAVVRGAQASNIETYGIYQGYKGLLAGNIKQLDKHDVSEQIERGGTFLMTARSKEFVEPEGTVKAAKVAEVFDLDCIVIIGGDGSFKGARALARLGVPVIGIPGTIDNDVSCSDYTIGFDTAMNTAVSAIDKLRDTSSSHQRCSVVEVMGRSAGWIAAYVGIATGAEAILLPEIPYDFDKDVLQVILKGKNSLKTHWIVVVAEGAGNASDIATRIEKYTGIESRATVLGYIQRGGSPSLRDRAEASLMGIKAVDCIISGKFNRIIAEKAGDIVDLDIEEALTESKTMPKAAMYVADRLF